MKRYLQILAAALVAASFAGGIATAQEAQKAKAAAPAPRNVGTHVYLLRGFMDIFSTGMDDLGVKLNRRGIRASVHGHADYPALAEAIGERYRKGQRESVVIIGHSLGANAAFSMADELAKYGVPVPLIIAYDPTSPMTAGSNVARVVNFYSSTNGWGTAIGRGAGFKGTLNNVDLSRRGEVGHTDIDKSPALHTQSIGYIQSIGGAAPTSTTERPKTEPKSNEGGVSSPATPAGGSTPEVAPQNASVTTPAARN
jgi:hypothetical protein